MFKIVLLLVATAVVIEGSPAVVRDSAVGAFRALFEQPTQGGWGSAVASFSNANADNLQQPDGNSHVFGESVSTFKQWTNDNGKISEHSGGLQVVDNDGKITKTAFTP